MNQNAAADTNNNTSMEESCPTEQYNGAKDDMVRITVLNIFRICSQTTELPFVSVGNGAAVFECTGNGGRTTHQQEFCHTKLWGDGGSSEC